MKRVIEEYGSVCQAFYLFANHTVLDFYPRFAFKDNRDILYWYCLEVFREQIFYGSKQDLIALYSLDGDTLNMYGLISTQLVNLASVLGSLQTPKTLHTIFHFQLEARGIGIESREFNAEEEDDPMFVRGDLDMSSIAYPVTAHT